MISLVTPEYAREHTAIEDLARYEDLNTKLALASGMVMQECELAAIPDAWIVDTQPTDAANISVITLAADMFSPAGVRYAVIPEPITTAVLLVLADLYENREASTANPLSEYVIQILNSSGYRKLTLA